MTLETSRLRLRPFTWDDLDFVSDLNADPEVARFIGTGRPRSREESRDLMSRAMAAYEEDGTGHLAVVLKETGKLVGRCGLWRFEVSEAPGERGLAVCYWEPGASPGDVDTRVVRELGYTFARRYWGRGFATEAARAVRDHAFGVRGEPMLMSLIVPENHASKNVARKMGMRLRDRVEVFGSLSERYTISIDEWTAIRNTESRPHRSGRAPDA